MKMIKKNFTQYIINGMNRSLPYSNYFSTMLSSSVCLGYEKAVSGVISVDRFYSDSLIFQQWFVGFSDAESSFLIHKVLDKSGDISKFSFIFSIELHIDDLHTLEYIKNKLGLGNIRIHKDKYIFAVSDKQGVYELISIFDKYNLNTTKYLDYLKFKEAFILYHERSRDIKVTKSKYLIQNLLELKGSMNKSRKIVTSKDYEEKINITKYWLLGFIEGDGSFFVSRTDIEPVFSIELSEEQYPVLLKIKEFIVDNLGFDKCSIFKLKNSSVISINKQKSRLGKPTVIFAIKNIFVLNNYLLPFLENMVFISKKGKDFLSFKIICNAVYKGSHKIEEIRSLILGLTYNMNSFRLSSNTKPVIWLSEEDIDKIINAEAIFEYYSDGRIMNKMTNKPLSLRNCIYEITLSNGEVLLVDTLKETLSKVNVSFRSLKKSLDECESAKLPSFEVKRIPVFVAI